MTADAFAVIRTSATTSPVEGDCDVCGYAALFQTRLYQLGDSSVGLLAEATHCGRCSVEGDDDR